jgi:hypothetical protein
MILDCGDEPPPDRMVPVSCCYGCERDQDGHCTHIALLNREAMDRIRPLLPLYPSSETPGLVPSWCPDLKPRMARLERKLEQERERRQHGR